MGIQFSYRLSDNQKRSLESTSYIFLLNFAKAGVVRIHIRLLISGLFTIPLFFNWIFETRTLRWDSFVIGHLGLLWRAQPGESA